MSNKLTIKSLSPAIAGWWAKFADDDKNEGSTNANANTYWYSPVAAWALCDIKSHYGSGLDTLILPVLPSESGMEPLHPDDTYCDLLYLPDEKFKRKDVPYCFAWEMVKKGESKE